MTDDDEIARHELIGEALGLEHRRDCPSHPANKAKAAGPAQVATPAYRKNYEAIFGHVIVGQA